MSDERQGGGAETLGPRPPADLPFPTSLCHRCAAPPRLIRSAASTFILCPVRPEKYPRQPVRDGECAAFLPKTG